MERQTFWVNFAKKRKDAVPGDVYDQHPLATTPEHANLVSSALVNEKARMLDIGWAPTGYGARHAPALDLDVPARLVPSSTPGHSHLYIDVAIRWAQYVAILRAFGDAGILEPGYVEACVRQGATYLRPEGVTKDVNDVKPMPPIDDSLWF